jgi:hypothetical protein
MDAWLQVSREGAGVVWVGALALKVIMGCSRLPSCWVHMSWLWIHWDPLGSCWVHMSGRMSWLWIIAEAGGIHIHIHIH